MQSASSREEDNNFKLSTWRILLMWFFILAMFGYLVYKLANLQLLHPEFYIDQANARVLRDYSMEPPRGLITDRNGKILAISQPLKSIYADAKEMHKQHVTSNPELIISIAKVLKLEPKELFAKLKDTNRRNVRLRQYVSVEDADKLRKLRVPGLYINDNYRRYYPTGAASAHLVGLLNREGRGVYGVEQSFNNYLSSEVLVKRAHKDIEGNIVENLAVVEQGKPGGNLILSIDDRLQSYAYQVLDARVKELEAECGTAVMLDTRTGEVLIMVNSPSFDPNDRGHFDSSSARNRAITDIFEPGSTAKSLVALAALEAKAVNWQQVFDTRPFIVNGKTIRDSHKMNSGTLGDIIKYSSNTGMAHIALAIGQYRILNMFSRFGFGELTSSGLVGENRGRLNADRKFWSEIDKATLGFGYGVAVTSLQLASAYASLANRGAKVPVTVLKAYRPAQPLQVADYKDVMNVQSALETVVSEGTGGRAAIDRYRIAGKTGTAKIAESGGYGKRYIATFAGFAPISNPRFALVVMIRAPQKGSIYGGTVSGPVFRDVMTRALQLYNVPPDRESTVKAKDSHK